MVFDFIFYTSLVCLIAYLTVMMFYYKTLLGKERTMRDFMKTNLDELKLSSANYKSSFKEVLEILIY